MIRKLAGAALACALVLAGVHAQADTKVRVASTNKEIFDNLPFFVAMERGLFKQEGLDVERSHFRGGGEVARAVSTNASDIGFVATTAGIIAAGKGEPLKLISAFTQPAYGITWVVLPNSTVKTPKDLAGKKVGISRPGSVTHTGLIAAIHAEGLQDKVEIVPVGGPGDGWAALKAGRVAATWYPVPDVHSLIDRGEARPVMEISKYMPHYLQGSFWALDSYLAKNGETVTKFLRAMDGAAEFIGTSPAEAAKIGAKHTGFAEGMIKRTIDEMPKGFFKIGVPVQAHYDGAAAEAVSSGALKEAPAMDKILDKRFIP
jgi:NitT/TauT family transport system substrate-binding protein